MAEPGRARREIARALRGLLVRFAGEDAKVVALEDARAQERATMLHERALQQSLVQALEHERTRTQALEAELAPLRTRWDTLRSLAGQGVAMYVDGDGELALTRARGPISQRVLLCSIPKSGTYLIDALFRELGVPPTGVHAAEWVLTDTRFGDRAELRRHPERHMHDVPIEQVARVVRPGQMQLGHLPCIARVHEAFDGFQILFSHRNLRDAMVSFMRYMVRNGLGSARSQGWGELPEGAEQMQRYCELHGVEFFNLVRPMVGWAAHPGVLRLPYETLVGDRGAPAQSALARELARAIGLAAPAGPPALHRALGTDTLTASGGRSQWARCWSEPVDAFFAAEGGPELNRVLGYDE